MARGIGIAVLLLIFGAIGFAYSGVYDVSASAPHLGDSADHMTAAELFWVTKHGIKMTGMPAWGVTHADDSIWPVVAFMLKLPELNGAEYSTLLASAEGIGHHGSEGAQGHQHVEPEHEAERVDEAEELVPGPEQSAHHHNEDHNGHTH